MIIDNEICERDNPLPTLATTQSNPAHIYRTYGGNLNCPGLRASIACRRLGW